LHVGAVVSGRLQTIQSELRRDVFSGNVAATLSGAAALKQIVRQKTHVSTDAFGVDLLKCSNRGRRKMNRNRTRWVLGPYSTDQQNQRQQHQLLAHALEAPSRLRTLYCSGD